MSEFAEMLVEGVRELQRQQGDPQLTWKAAGYPCVPGDARLGRTLGIGGMTVDLDMLVAIILSDFPNGTPAPKKDRVIVGGISYLVEMTRTASMGGVMVLGLINESKGS